MRKFLDVKNLDPVRDGVAAAQDAARKVGDAAESQATLNIALTAVCVSALLVAVLLVQHAARTGAGQ